MTLGYFVRDLKGVKTQLSSENSFWNKFLQNRLDSELGTEFHVPIISKSGSLKLLEPSGPVQAFTGIILPFF